jgi:hypothetical protein
MKHGESRAGCKSREAHPPGNHKPGKCQIASMVKISEPVIKTVINDKRKWLIRLSKKGTGGGQQRLVAAFSRPIRFPVDSKRLIRRTSRGKRGNPASLPALGCQKKRRPCCNGTDTGLNVTRHESAPTSDGSFIAREEVEPTL